MSGKILFGKGNTVGVATLLLLLILCQGQGCPMGGLPFDIEGLLDILDTEGEMDPVGEDEGEGDIAEQDCDPAQEGCEESDGDGDGVSDVLDSCPETGEGEVADEFGCSCEDDNACEDDVVDSDGDGVDDVLDSCPQTAEGEEVDEFGCSANDV